MSFKVGDRVRCVDPGQWTKLVKGLVYKVTDIDESSEFGGSVCVDGIEDWRYADRFELIPQHPAESPDDWVALPSDHVLRSTVDQYRTCLGEWKIVDNISGKPVSWLETKRARCRRRDYPHQPVEVHTGGPYVARSEYERVCSERDDAVAQAVWIRDEAVMLAAERDQLKADQESLLADLKATEQTVIHLNKRVFANAANGWPLVPVDPSCIPEGHRAVEVTCNAKGRKVVSYESQPIHLNGNDEWPRLVVEPIPTPPAPEALPRPEFPAWIRAGWWVAMDNDGDWFGYEKEPTLIDKLKQWGSTIPFPIIISQLTPSMRAVPRDRWREAKWQVNHD